MSREQPKIEKRKGLLLVDSTRCIGCFGCEVACKLEHDLPAGPRIFKVIRMGPLENGDDLVMNFTAVTCLHCDRPACVPACPTGAMKKREDGIVFSDPELCIGCRTCAISCPFGVPELNPATGKIAKCDGCMDRVEQDLWPACALKCPTGALSFGTSTSVVQQVRQQEAMRIVRSLKVDA